MQKQEPEESGDWSDGSGWNLKRTSTRHAKYKNLKVRGTGVTVVGCCKNG